MSEILSVFVMPWFRSIQWLGSKQKKPPTNQRSEFYTLTLMLSFVGGLSCMSGFNHPALRGRICLSCRTGQLVWSWSYTSVKGLPYLLICPPSFNCHLYKQFIFFWDVIFFFTVERSAPWEEFVCF